MWRQYILWVFLRMVFTTQKLKFSIKNFFSKYDQIRKKLRVWSHLLKKPIMENFIFCAVVNLKLPILLWKASLRSSFPEVFLGKGVLKMCSTFTEHPCRSVISMKLFQHGCSSVNLLHIFRAAFPENTSGGLLLFVLFK